MGLFEAIIEANHRALAGDASAGLRPSEWAGSLPVVVLTCFDPRMHPLMPEVLGIAERNFVWVTSAGNIVTGPWSSLARSLALACIAHDCREIVVLGHTDCRFFQPALLRVPAGLEGHLIELEAGGKRDETGNVRLAATFLRQSPLIAPAIPVHGLMVDIETGRLEWVVNGYESEAHDATQPTDAGPPVEDQQPPDHLGGGLPPIGSGWL